MGGATLPTCVIPTIWRGTCGGRRLVFCRGRARGCNSAPPPPGDPGDPQRDGPHHGRPGGRGGVHRVDRPPPRGGGRKLGTVGSRPPISSSPFPLPEPEICHNFYNK
eukprot:1183711-Prorocentrum_minimum.AAC.2